MIDAGATRFVRGKESKNGGSWDAGIKVVLFFFGATSYDNVTTAATEVSEIAQQNKGGGTETALRATMTDDGRRGRGIMNYISMRGHRAPP